MERGKFVYKKKRRQLLLSFDEETNIRKTKPEDVIN